MGGGSAKALAKHSKKIRKEVRLDVRKDLERKLPGYEEHSVQSLRNARSRTRLDAATTSSLAYLKGLIDPINYGPGVRLPSDGMFPTSTASSFNRFVLPIATQTGGANTNRTAGLMVWPDVQKQYSTLSSINIDNHSTLVWNTLQNGGAWSTVSSNAVLYRGCVNMAVTFTCQAALLKRGGRLVATLLPPGSGYPTDVDAAFAYNRTIVLDLAKMGEQTTFFWLPALGEAGVALASGGSLDVTSFYRTASMWTSTANSQIVNGDPVWAFFFQTSDNTAVTLDFTVQINNNFEFIPSFGGASQVFKTAVVAGGEADASRALKPLEAAVGPSVMSQVATGALNAVSSVGQAMTHLGMQSKDPGMFFGGMVASNGANAVKNVLSGDYAQATYSAIGAGISALPFLFSPEADRQHRLAMSAGLPELSPMSSHVPGTSLRLFRPSVLDPDDFDHRLAIALRKRCLPSLTAKNLKAREPEWEMDEKDAEPQSPAPSQHVPKTRAQTVIR